MKQLWCAYRSDQHNKFGGRVFLSYVGWHDDANSAMEEAKKRNPAVPESVIQVNRA